MQKVLVGWRKVTGVELMREQLPSLGETTRAKQLIGEQCVLPIWSIHILMLMPWVQETSWNKEQGSFDSWEVISPQMRVQAPGRTVFFLTEFQINGMLVSGRRDLLPS